MFRTGDDSAGRFGGQGDHCAAADQPGLWHRPRRHRHRRARSASPCRTPCLLGFSLAEWALPAADFPDSTSTIECRTSEITVGVPTSCRYAWHRQQSSGSASMLTDSAAAASLCRSLQHHSASGAHWHHHAPCLLPSFGALIFSFSPGSDSRSALSVISFYRVACHVLAAGCVGRRYPATDGPSQ